MSDLQQRDKDKKEHEAKVKKEMKERDDMIEEARKEEPEPVKPIITTTLARAPKEVKDRLTAKRAAELMRTEGKENLMDMILDKVEQNARGLIPPQKNCGLNKTMFDKAWPIERVQSDLIALGYQVSRDAEWVIFFDPLKYD